MKLAMQWRWSTAAIMVAAGIATLSSPSHAAPTRNACDVAKEYLRLTEMQQYDRIGDLWADDAVFYAPNGQTIRGRHAIGDFYSAFLKKITPVNRIGSLTFDRRARRCALEIETRVVRGPSGEWVPDAKGEFVGTVIDLFTVNRKGKITRMKVYLAPLPKD
ncbi:nuclear transport factor 2 family protein [Novosphingobium colocasiae]|uniref:SnoaL-like domain-containing protein n=2 Tax=Novosphingobium colocasiae TaxID=1256513 RepID=A0A918PIT5_9SPHN|nr:hypothetical protein GCM10011614_27800 [Novosphingobium colocasiae]